MTKWNSEAQAREEIKALVAEYYHEFKEKKEPFKEGDRITYAARVFDEKEMCALTDATLDFWLTTGRFSDEFEKKFAESDRVFRPDRAGTRRASDPPRRRGHHGGVRVPDDGDADAAVRRRPCVCGRDGAAVQH